MVKVFSLGYGGWKSIEDFVERLKSLKITVLVDVRRFPTSKNPDFKKENLEVELPKHNIRYEYMGETLGGYRRGGYEKYTETENYKEGIRRLQELVREESGNIAIMCLERSHRHCHRRFITETLSKKGIEVVHVEK